MGVCHCQYALIITYNVMNFIIYTNLYYMYIYIHKINYEEVHLAHHKN